MKNNIANRRRFIKSSAFGLIGITAFNSAYAKNISQNIFLTDEEKIFYRYPSMNDEMVSAIIGAAHTNLEKVKELVSGRPELANASWDWGFGDWETALGAASHMGRKDIAEFLMNHGARPDIFTLAMLGRLKGVQDTVEMMPGIQSKPGPHGITLLQHAKSRLRFTDLSEDEKSNTNKTIAYLEGLGNADIKAKSLEITEDEQKIYLGEYRFGEAEDEIFEVNLNSRNFLQISRKGTFGRVMNKTDEHVFSPGGAASVNIRFQVKGGKALSFTIHEPSPLISAVRI